MLAELWLVSNEISYLPASFGQLAQLRRLELSANALAELPRAFSRLTALRKLWLRDNSLTAFPQQLCALERLATLALENNRITALPRAVGHMPALGAPPHPAPTLPPPCPHSAPALHLGVLLSAGVAARGRAE